MHNKKEKTNVLIWGEHINIKHFIFALVLSLAAVIITVSFIPSDTDNNIKLLYGLISLVAAFIVNVLLIKPKRNIKIVEVEK